MIQMPILKCFKYFIWCMRSSKSIFEVQLLLFLNWKFKSYLYFIFHWLNNRKKHLLLSLHSRKKRFFSTFSFQFIFCWIYTNWTKVNILISTIFYPVEHFVRHRYESPLIRWRIQFDQLGDGIGAVRCCQLLGPLSTVRIQQDEFEIGEVVY